MSSSIGGPIETSGLVFDGALGIFYFPSKAWILS